MFIQSITSLLENCNSLGAYSFHLTSLNKSKLWSGGGSLVVQWLRLHASTAGGMRLIPGWETKIPRAVWNRQNVRINQNQNQNSDLRMLLLGLRNL